MTASRALGLGLALVGALALIGSLPREARPAPAAHPPAAPRRRSLLSRLRGVRRPARGAWSVLTPTSGAAEPRHECTLAELGGKLYLIGGRGRHHVDVWDPSSSSWRRGRTRHAELHHAQPIAYRDTIWLWGGMVGPYPDEKPVAHVLLYEPRSDTVRNGPRLPRGRARGSGGAALADGRMLFAGGIVDGHNGGAVPWLDAYEPERGAWARLPDAPHARDHFAAVALGRALYLAGGRTTSLRTGQLLDLTVAPVDVFDFESQRWSTLREPLPTLRAGVAAVALGGELVVIGGESAAQRAAHDEVEAYDPRARAWRALPRLAEGAHGTGAVALGGRIYLAGGAATRGGDAGPPRESALVQVYQP